jgi:hypothetical protein
MAIVMSEGNPRPAPSPIRTIAGMISVTYVASSDVRVESTRPAPMATRPGNRVARGPKHVIRAGRDAKGHRSHDDRRGKEREPDLEGVVGEDALEVERAQEEHPDDQQRLHEVRARDVARPKETQRHQRVGRAAREAIAGSSSSARRSRPSPRGPGQRSRS